MYSIPCSRFYSGNREKTRSALVLDLYNLCGQYVLEVHCPMNQLSVDGSQMEGVIPHPEIRVRVDEANLFV